MKTYIIKTFQNLIEKNYIDVYKKNFENFKKILNFVGKIFKFSKEYSVFI